MGKAAVQKTCKACGERKPNSKFHKNGDYWRANCADCENNWRAGYQKQRRIPKERRATEMKMKAAEAQVYVVTYAQNATPVHKPFFAALRRYCEHRGAELLVLPGRYRNPTSIWSSKDRDDDWWDETIVPFLFSGRKKIGRHLIVYGDISIQPTATRPLTGFEAFAGGASAIFGHTRLQLRTVATAQRRYPRVFSTTGAVTRANYTRTKAGKRGESHHVIGALVVEQDGDLFHLRQLNATQDGSFIDLEHRYTAEGIEVAERPLALICGDVHVDQPDAQALAATFVGEDSIVGALNPRQLVLHDVLDFGTRSHHRRRDPFIRYALAKTPDRDRVEDEVVRAIRFLDAVSSEDRTTVVVRSNHDEFFERWLKEEDPRQDPINAPFFHSVWADMLAEHARTDQWVNAFELMYRRYGKKPKLLKFLSREATLRIGGIECGFHGDDGINGTRGSLEQYARLGGKSVTGHSHSPGIIDGAYAVGVKGALDQGYNRRPSGWLQTDCLIYANGKRVLITVVEGRWRAPPRRREART